MQVKATQRGYFGAIREPGDVFDVPDDTAECSWFAPVEQTDAPAKNGKKGKQEAPLA